LLVVQIQLSFGHPLAHHQELIICNSRLWFTYCRKRYCFVNLHLRQDRIYCSTNFYTVIIELIQSQPTSCITLSDLLLVVQIQLSFGHPLAHHQELINCSSRLWFTYCHKRYCFVNLHLRQDRIYCFTNFYTVIIELIQSQPTSCISLSDLLLVVQIQLSFGHPLAHHQELIICNSRLWFAYCHKRYCFVNLHLRQDRIYCFTNFYTVIIELIQSQPTSCITLRFIARRSNTVLAQ